MPHGLWRLSLAAALFLVVACGDDDDGGDDDDNGPASAAETATSGGDEPSDTGTPGAPTETVRIGVPVSLSGNLSSSGKPGLDGVRLAADEINEAGGFEVDGTRYSFEVVEEDDRSEPSAAVAAANGLVEDEGIQFLIGPISSALALPVAQTVGSRAFVMSPGSALESNLTEENVAEGGSFRYVIQLSSTAPRRTGQTLDAIREFVPDAQTIGLLVRDDSAGHSLGESLVDLMAEEGYEVVSRQFYPPETTDFGPFVQTVANDRPDLLIMGYVPVEAQTLVRQCEELDCAAAYFGIAIPAPFAVDEMEGGTLDSPFYTYYVPNTLDYPTIPSVEEFIESAEAANIELTPSHSGAIWTYDAVYLLMNAMQEAGSVDDLEAILEAMRQVEFDGAAGPIDLTENNIVNHGIDVCSVLPPDGEVTCEFFRRD